MSTIAGILRGGDGPAEETGDGARGMLADGLANLIPKPDVALAQHVLPGPSGTVLTRPGPVLSSADGATENDLDATARIARAFAEHFGAGALPMELQTASKDFSDVPRALGVPYTYWWVGVGSGSG
ncbi:hypothetical protein ACTU6U_11090 [Microbacterium sp. A196]|uniref:hypothetical protein n=1 Tax=unclassified Microbacterium TaxID=2609290 RepID=UPI003FCEFF6B